MNFLIFCLKVKQNIKNPRSIFNRVIARAFIIESDNSEHSVYFYQVSIKTKNLPSINLKAQVIFFMRVTDLHMM